MQYPYDPDQPSPEGAANTHGRPPGLEFSMGIALFGVVIMLFFLIQTGVFVNGVLQHSPDLMKEGFSLDLLSDPRMEERMNELVFNGDLVAHEAFWSGAVCTLLILVSVRLWKRGQTSAFLGLKTPSWRNALLWFGVFMALGLVIEMLAWLSPSFKTDFMQKVIGSTTSMGWLVLGVGVMAPLFEEFLLRGLLYGTLRHTVDEHAGVAITAGVFALMHMQYDMAVMMLILPMGVVLGYARSRSGSIWVPVLLHMVNNLITIVFPA